MREKMIERAKIYLNSTNQRDHVAPYGYLQWRIVCWNKTVYTTLLVPIITEFAKSNSVKHEEAMDLKPEDQVSIKHCMKAEATRTLKHW